MEIGDDGEVRTCRSEASFGRIFYESAEIDALIAKYGAAIAIRGRKFYFLRYVEAVRMSRTPAEIRSTRIGALARLPAFFALENKRTVVAGGSPAATWKAELLSAAGARVEVFAAAPSEEMLALAAAPPRGAVIVHQRAWDAGDCNGAAIAVADCADDKEAEKFATAARAAGVPINVIDRPAFCDFSFGAIVNRSPLVIGISTDGASP